MSGVGGVDPARLDRAIAAIDEVNATGPETMVVDGVARPKEVVHADMAVAWVRRLDPEPTEEQILAARAHHLRRWSVPRSDYPEGRAGYLRWRRDLKEQHAAEVGDILRSCGYPDDAIERVQAIVRKEGLRSDAAVQTHEDALCLVFLETQFEDLVLRLGEDKAVDVVRKTVAKMSGPAIEAAQQLDHTAVCRRVLAAAAG